MRGGGRSLAADDVDAAVAFNARFHAKIMELAGNADPPNSPHRSTAGSARLHADRPAARPAVLDRARAPDPPPSPAGTSRRRRG